MLILNRDKYDSSFGTFILGFATVGLNVTFAGVVGYGIYHVVLHTGIHWGVALMCALWGAFNCKIVSVKIETY